MSAFIGSGVVSVTPYVAGTAFDSLTGWEDVGNVSALSLNVTENRQELRNYRTPAGGVYASAARVESVSIQMDFRDFSAENLALALWGTGTTATGVTTIEALINSAPLVAIKFEGVNGVDGKDVDGKFFKARLSAPQNIGLIGDDFGTLQITATLEADTSITTAGKSQYFQLLVED